MSKNFRRCLNFEIENKLQSLCYKNENFTAEKPIILKINFHEIFKFSSEKLYFLT